VNASALPKVLVIEDEPSICWGFRQLSARVPCEVVDVGSAEAALALCRAQEFAAIVTDVRLPGQSGLAAIAALKETHGTRPIIVMTAFGDLQTAVEAVRLGAFEYLLKPFELERVVAMLRRALAASVEEIEAPSAETAAPRTVSNQLVGNSAAIQNLFVNIALAASADANILIGGESGTGKELVAQAIHQHSGRAARPFVVVNVAALSPGLAESELFGHVKGAFTGADHSRVGLIEQAAGGTLFLDEVAEIPLPLQVKLLRTLEQKQISPVGSNEVRAVDFRIISATHQDLLHCSRQGTFRHDLYYRLAAFRIEIPPLRERQEDIVPLAKHFLSMAAGNSGIAKQLTAAAVAELQHRLWWGNVRELRQAMEHAAVVCRGQTIDTVHLPPALPSLVPGGAGNEAGEQNIDGRLSELLHSWTNDQLADPEQRGRVFERLMQLVERPVFRAALEQAGGNFSKAAQSLGVHRTTIRKKLEADFPGADD
jgi:two-component system nitrogen regulation response regulator GlnG